ncbi:hypothetical protein H9P43_000072 [Blastocladiella emersonii ATCC 22665]|nr:hypothetical protein H9P43_000072 [Blastocladiella emersonii ATCC 22665]
MALQCYCLLFLFDLLAIGNVVVSHCISRGMVQAKDPNQFSFGVQRLEVVYAFANALALLFSGMYALKEALETMLEQEDHKDSESSPLSAIYPVAAAAIGVLAIAKLHIHRPYHAMVTPHAFSDLANNPFIQAHGLVLAILLASMWVQGMYAGSPARTLVHVGPAADALAASAIGCVLMWLATPLAVACGQVLLQVTPAPVALAVQRACSEVVALDGVAQITKVHYWSTGGFGSYTGLLHVQRRARADPETVRAAILERLRAGRVPGDWWVQIEKAQPQYI